MTLELTLKINKPERTPEPDTDAINNLFAQEQELYWTNLESEPVSVTDAESERAA